MVLDGKKDETLRVLLEKRLVCFLGSDCGCDRRLGDDHLLLWEIWNADNGLVDVLLVCRREVELLRRRVGHLECVNGCSRL